MTRKPIQGFTLLEVLVVVLIIGILAGFISLSMSNRAVDDRMETEARRLQQLVQLAAEEAQLKGMEIGLRQTTEGFDFLTPDPGGVWTVFEGGPLRAREIAAPFYLELYVEGRLIAPVAVNRERERRLSGDDEQAQQARQSSEPLPQPQVFLLSSGEMTPFWLDLKLSKHPGFYRLECDALARCKLERRQVES